MAGKSNNKQKNKKSILIYQLPAKHKKNALATFPDECIEKVVQDSNGLQICFKNYNFARKGLRRGTIEVNGLSYNVYPMVTILTVRDIGAYAFGLDIRNAMRSYGCVIDLHPVRNVRKNSNFEKSCFMSDYRITLDVPEVFANFNLTPVKLPGTDFTFEVLFFCRLCGHNGHKQFQCRDQDSRKRSRNRSSEEHRRTISESNTSDEMDTMEDYKTNFCLNPPYSQKFNSCKMNVKNEPGEDNCGNNKFNSYKQETSKGYAVALGLSKSKRDNDTPATCDYFYGQKKYSRHNNLGGIKLKNNPHTTFQVDSSVQKAPKSYKPDPSFSKSKYHHSTYVKSGNVSEKCFQNNVLRNEEDSSKQQFGVKNKSASEKSPANLADRRYLEDSSVISSDSVDDSQKSETSFKSKLGNKTMRPLTTYKPADEALLIVLATILPQDADLMIYRNHVNQAKLLGPKNVTENHVGELRKILTMSKSTNKKNFGTEERKFLGWLKRFLRKVTLAKNIPKTSQIHSHKKIPTDGQRVPKVFRERESSRQKNVALSEGIKMAILKTPGELEPELLCNFLKQVRGRGQKNLLKITSIFTKNIAALAQQLLELQHTYYLHVTIIGNDEDRDIIYIDRLRQRLLKLDDNCQRSYVDAKADIFMRQSTSSKPPYNT